MPSFSKRSLAKLKTAHQDHQTLFNYVVKHFDCSVVYGYRLPEEQFSLYKKGREFINGEWVVTDKRLVVTNCDGYNIRSKHNEYPSHAVDVVPYPTMYEDEDTIRHFAGFVLGAAAMLKEYGAIDNKIYCGLDWDGDNDLHDQQLFDAVHFEVRI